MNLTDKYFIAALGVPSAITVGILSIPTTMGGTVAAMYASFFIGLPLGVWGCLKSLDAPVEPPHSKANGGGLPPQVARLSGVDQPAIDAASASQSSSMIAPEPKAKSRVRQAQAKAASPQPDKPEPKAEKPQAECSGGKRARIHTQNYGGGDSGSLGSGIGGHPAGYGFGFGCGD